MADEPERWLTIKEAMAEIRVSRRTIYNWKDRDQVTWKRTAGGPIRILASSLWLAGKPLEPSIVAPTPAPVVPPRLTPVPVRKTLATQTFASVYADEQRDHQARQVEKARRRS